MKTRKNRECKNIDAIQMSPFIPLPKWKEKTRKIERNRTEILKRKRKTINKWIIMNKLRQEENNDEKKMIHKPSDMQDYEWLRFNKLIVIRFKVKWIKHTHTHIDTYLTYPRLLFLGKILCFFFFLF